MTHELHPETVIRGGPTGPRAALARGPDVWELIGLIQESGKTGDAAVAFAAEWCSISEQHVRAAVSYYEAHPADVDKRIRRNRDLADAAEAEWRRDRAHRPPAGS
jgi:hypothetical protein